ncbi:unnamed protein product [Bursaphelenchus okinawaensis]|uniref:Uncharacterized protein n=1 Tax=Bursaphelenchus okinawaensis TaxID=465554 RepID=A0A811JRQ2_9BILA|nr:unnamed protein product [Bursaphelenchus okinawaensis]CAG9080131.1 unnamed protein product [Bursaphelenchus okinawaensis]
MIQQGMETQVLEGVSSTRHRLESCIQDIQQLDALRLKHKLLIEQLRRDYPSMKSFVESLGDSTDSEGHSPRSTESQRTSGSCDSGFAQNTDNILTYSNFRKLSLEERRDARKNVLNSGHLVENTLKNLTTQFNPVLPKPSWTMRSKGPLDSANRPQSCFGKMENENGSSRPSSLIVTSKRGSRILDSFAQLTPPPVTRKFATVQPPVGGDGSARGHGKVRHSDVKGYGTDRNDGTVKHGDVKSTGSVRRKDGEVGTSGTGGTFKNYSTLDTKSSNQTYNKVGTIRNDEAGAVSTNSTSIANIHTKPYSAVKAYGTNRSHDIVKNDSTAKADSTVNPNSRVRDTYQSMTNGTISTARINGTIQADGPPKIMVKSSPQKRESIIQHCPETLMSSRNVQKAELCNPSQSNTHNNIVSSTNNTMVDNISSPSTDLPKTPFSTSPTSAFHNVSTNLSSRTANNNTPCLQKGIKKTSSFEIPTVTQTVAPFNWKNASMVDEIYRKPSMEDELERVNSSYLPHTEYNRYAYELEEHDYCGSNYNMTQNESRKTSESHVNQLEHRWQKSVASEAPTIQKCEPKPAARSRLTPLPKLQNATLTAASNSASKFTSSCSIAISVPSKNPNRPVIRVRRPKEWHESDL